MGWDEALLRKARARARVDGYVSMTGRFSSYDKGEIGRVLGTSFDELPEEMQEEFAIEHQKGVAISKTRGSGILSHTGRG